MSATAAGQAVEWRRHLHANPELSFHEHETSRFIAETLESFGGLEITRPTPTSVLARLVGDAPGRTVALRADIDALPIVEENTFAFISGTSGVMHACGHDGHAAMLLAVAQALVARRAEIAGQVRFIFQHAEELPPGGARELVAAGVLDGVDVIVGCHLISMLPAGTAAMIAGPAMAAADTFELTIRGKGGHGAFPHETVDTVAVAAQAVTNLQHVVARNVDPLRPAVLSVTRIAGGSANNIIPETVELGGTVRTFSNEDRDTIRQAMERVLRGVTAAHGAEFELRYDIGYDAVVNDAAVSAVVAEAIREELGAGGLVETAPVMGGDDFSAYLHEVPGAYFFVGSASEHADSAFPHHHPRFTVDEEALANGIGIFLRATLALLRQGR
jgi:amidohydrolase